VSTPLRERPDAPLGTLIFRAGLLPAETIESALEEGVKTGKRLGEILTERGLISEVDLARLLAGQKGLEFVILREQIVDPSAAALFTEEQARLFRALPYALEGELPVVAIADPTDDVLMRNIREALGRDDARFVVSARGELAEISADVYSKPLAPAPAPQPEAPEAPPEPEVVAHEHTNGSAPADAELIMPAPAYEPPAEPAASEPVPGPELAPEPEPVAVAPEAPAFPAPAAEQPAAPEPAVAPEPTPEPEPVTAYEPQPAFVEEPTPVPPAVPAPEAPAAFEPPAPVEPVAPPQPLLPEPEPEPTPEPEPVLHFEQPAAQAPPAPEATEPEVVPVAAPEPEAALEPIPFPQPTPAPPAPPYPPAAEAPEVPAEPAPAPEPPAPVQEPVADAVEWRLTIRLANGERVEAGDFADLESAKSEAKTIMAQVADADSGDWPFVNGRFLKPDTIVSVDIAEHSGDES
jgi:hypothetical protein